MKKKSDKKPISARVFHGQGNTSDDKRFLKDSRRWL